MRWLKDNRKLLNAKILPMERRYEYKCNPQSGYKAYSVESPRFLRVFLAWVLSTVYSSHNIECLGTF